MSRRRIVKYAGRGWTGGVDVEKKIEFEVLGKPVGKGRPRFRNAGKFVQTYTPEKTAVFENLVQKHLTKLNGKLIDKSADA